MAGLLTWAVARMFEIKSNATSLRYTKYNRKIRYRLSAIATFAEKVDRRSFLRYSHYYYCVTKLYARIARLGLGRSTGSVIVDQR